MLESKTYDKVHGSMAQPGDHVGCGGITKGGRRRAGDGMPGTVLAGNGALAGGWLQQTAACGRQLAAMAGGRDGNRQRTGAEDGLARILKACCRQVAGMVHAWRMGQRSIFFKRGPNLTP